jgi:LuxR family transcriptional regulator, maltose regulon positive regulatory protein
VPATTGRAAAHRKDRTGLDYPGLASKLAVPVLPRWMVTRERITKLVAEGTDGPLTVITGPPGAGKTVALAAWAAADPGRGPVAWVRLDRFDNRPRTFWSYLLQALGHAGVVIPAGLPAAAAGDGGTFARRLAQVVAGQEPTVLLVLDDLHVLTNPVCLDGLAYLVRNGGPGLRLLAASRMDPVLPLHRYRLTGELTEIRAEDLAFSTSEAELLLAQHGINLPPESLRMLHSRVEGWAAGLRLAAISMADHPDPRQFVKELAAEDSAITGYLVEEVLNAQPAGAREVLLKTSILDRVNGELAAEVAGNDRAGEVICELARANAFVEPAGHGWYRYHSLFADVLRLKLRYRSPGDLAQLHRRAAQWLHRNGMLAEAVSQTIAAGDWPLAAQMVADELAIGPLLDPCACEHAAAALKDVPDLTGSKVPAPLVVAAALALREKADGPAAALLHGAERLLEPLPAGQQVPARFGAVQVRMELAQRTGDLDAAAAAVTQAGELAGRLPPDLVTHHPQVRAWLLASRAAVDMWAGRFGEAVKALEQAAATGSPCQCADAVGRQALLEAIAGRLDRAGKLAAPAAMPGSRALGADPHPSAAAQVARAWVSVEHNKLSDTASQLSRAQDGLRAHPDRLVSALAWLVAARLSLAKGQAAVAADMAARARHGWPAPAWLAEQLALAETAAHAAAGHPQAALATAGHAGPPSSPTGAIARARAHLAAKDAQAAERTLPSAPALTTSHAPGRLRVEAELARAELCYTTGDPSRGRRFLAQALKLAQPEQLVLPFALQRTWIDPVLRHDPALTHTFHQALHPAHALPRDNERGHGQPGPVIIEPLTPRELDILRSVSQMLSTAEIAEQMYLSVNTVKTHLKNIFRKRKHSRPRSA